MRAFVAALACLTLSGCPLDDDPLGGDTDAGLPAAGPWTLRPHPCPARTSEALFPAADGTIYVGCGTGADGKGLWRTTNEGVTWAPIGGFEAWRVNDIDPAPDGGLYLACIHTTSRDVVVHRAPDGTITPLHTRTVQVNESFHVGHFARTDAGEAIAESLTGGALVYRAQDGVLFRGRDIWSSDGLGHQILGLTTDGERFYAVGSTIAEPPTVFLPPIGADRSDSLFTPVRPLGEAISGELWALAVDGERLVAVGVDQDADRGLVLVGRTDAFNAEAWAAPDVAGQVSGASWFRGVCLRGDRIVAVGERQPWRRGGGLVFESTDGGDTWTNIAPDADAPAWHRCAILDDGRLLVAGADGAFAIHSGP